jgi:Uncharacterized protein conserved in bacteria (DUF2059)
MRLLRLFLFPLLIAGSAAAAAGAADRADIDRLWRLMAMDDVVAVMREEGLDYGRSLDDDMLDGRGGAGWMAIVGVIYDAGRMSETAHKRFAEDLASTDIAPMLAFYDSDLGRRVIGLELSARRALLAPDVEAASQDRATRMRDAGDPRIAMISRFVEVNDLVESNVMGALNSSYAFYRGMNEGGALGDEMAEDEILSDVWAQEPGVRTETGDWVYSFLVLAYQPLSDADLEAYTGFSRTASGQLLNRAIFTAFDQMFLDISRALGRGVSHYMDGQEL